MENLIFKDLNLSEEIQKAISDMGFEEATPIQAQSIPHIMAGKDLIGQAQTGTGKTCAFGIPAIEMIDQEIDGIQVLVLCPTRELAIQTSEELKAVSKYKKNIKILPVYGGQPIDRQIMALKKKPQIIIGTPGRIMDHMRRNTLKFGNLRMIVLDEADEMLNMGFREDIDVILEKVPEKMQTIFFSATMPREILELTGKYQNKPIHIKAAHKEMTVAGIGQYYLEVPESAKLEVLSRILDTQEMKLSLVFCNTKKRVDELTSSLQSRGYAAESLHGDMKQEQRDRVMSRFRKGQIDILIATDVAARGIDVDDIEAVFNYDVPNDEEYYVHRIGRTGRAGRTGKAYTFVIGREIYKLKEIQRYTKSNIALIKPPTLVDVEERKLQTILGSLKELISKNHFSRYIAHIEKTVDELNAQNTDENENYITTLDVAAALLQMAADKSGNTPNLTLEIDQNRYEPNRFEPNRFDQGNNDDGGDPMTRLFINVGRENKVSPSNIIECIASVTKMSGKLIGAIDIYDKFTFVDVPREYASEVMASMKNYPIKGKRINIEKSNKKAESPKRKRSTKKI